MTYAAAAGAAGGGAAGEGEVVLAAATFGARFLVAGFRRGTGFLATGFFTARFASFGRFRATGRTFRLVVARVGFAGFPSFAARRASRYFLIFAFGRPLCSEQTIPNTGAARFLQPGTGQS